MNVHDLVKLTTSLMDARSSDENSLYMEKYMKNLFKFYGVKSPVRKAIQRELKPHWKQLNHDEIFEYAELLWALPQRELQYIAVDAIETRSKKIDASFLPRIEKLITTKSWWDTVDALSPNVAGSIFLRYLDSKMKWVEKWNQSSNLWLNRSAIYSTTTKN